jgi:hypothetical protein
MVQSRDGVGIDVTLAKPEGDYSCLRRVAARSLRAKSHERIDAGGSSCRDVTRDERGEPE